MDKIRSAFLALSGPVKLAIIAALVIGLAVAFSTIAGSVQKRRHERERGELQGQIKTAQDKASAEIERANAAHIRAEMLEAELAKANQRLLDANAERLDAHNLTQTTRATYVTKTKQVEVPRYITGNASADSIELCARLRAAGFDCK